MASISLAAVSRTGLSDRLVGEVLPGLETRLQRLTAGSDEWRALLSQVYAAQDGFAERVEQLRQAIADGSFSLALELRSASDLQGAQAAYAAGEAGNGERILLNADWAASATDAELERTLLEELGHSFDIALNGGVDSAGDEGQLFAALALGLPLDPASLSAIRQENDGGVLQLDGQAVAVEFAANPQYNASTFDTDKDGVLDASDPDDDNDGILDTVEANAVAVAWRPTRDDFSYAQNTAGGNTTHDAAGLFLTGDRNDPYNFFDGNDSTELRVHALDVYEFRLPTGGLTAGASFNIVEGPASNGNDGTAAVLASLNTTDPNGNANNASGGGLGWKTISAAFGITSVTQLGTLLPTMATSLSRVLMASLSSCITARVIRISV